MDLDPAKLVIVHFPAPVLREKAKPVETVDQTVRDVVERMIELMHEAEGVGLAAPQVGLPWRLFLARDADEGSPVDVYINPRLELHPGDMVFREEGCLSLPRITADIRRPATVTITARGLDDQEFTRQDGDFLARVWQHEYDHLDGTLIIDKMSPRDRLANRRAIKELEKKGAGAVSPRVR